MSRDHVFAVCVWDSRRVGRVKIARLLALRSDGRGAHYSFLGWRPRRSGYWTEATIVDVNDDLAVLEFPEWGRDLLRREPLGLLPADARQIGARLEVKADLGSVSESALNPSGWRPAGRPDKADGARRP